MYYFFEVKVLIIVIIIAKRTYFLCSYIQNSMNGPCLSLSLQFLPILGRTRRNSKVTKSAGPILEIFQFRLIERNAAIS